jgi:hypothetical protein
MFDHKAYRAAHRDAARAYARAYYTANKTELLAYQKNYRIEHKDKIRNANRVAKHDLTPEGFALMFEKQAGACAICHEPFTETPQIDHDHDCCGETHACAKCRRGLLCKHCNRGIGCLKDSVEILRNALEYLAKYERQEKSAA